MMARSPVERGEAVLPAPAPQIASLVGAAFPQDPFTGIGSTADYAALVIGARCNLSPAVAMRVVELVGIGAAS